jgi:redox-sensitive bicupin YhaK (pirin superfamily)
MVEKKVKQLLFSQMVDMGGIPVRQPLPTQQVEMIDPFLLLHHHVSQIPAGSHPRSIGVGPHPHRGFSPVTFIYQGEVNHKDSRGNDAIVGAGGVQWMNAGMGIIHSERPPAAFAEKGGVQEIIQLWINTPAALKMQQPAYFSLDEQSIPLLLEDAGKVKLKLVAGRYKGVNGFQQTNSELLILNIDMEKDAQCTLEVPNGFNACLYNFDASIEVGSFGMVEPLYLVSFKEEGNIIDIKAREKTRLLFLSGAPLNEPVVSYGPFVMNNQTQIMEAMRDYQMGKMGMLED